MTDAAQPTRDPAPVAPSDGNRREVAVRRRSLFQSRSFVVALMLVSASALLLAAAHPPLDHGWLAWFGLVPLVLAIDSSIGSLETWLAVWIGALVFHLCGTSWLGDSEDSLAMLRWILLCELISLYWVTVVPAVRLLRRNGVPLIIAFPLVWTAMEFVRAQVGLAFSASGYPWLQLGHTQIDWAAVAQLADIGGVFTITALAALVNAAMADVLKTAWVCRATGPRVVGALGLIGMLLMTAVAYGRLRIAAMQDRAGPSVCLVPDKFQLDETLALADQLGRGIPADTAREASPALADVWIWPEVAVSTPLVQIDSGLPPPSNGNDATASLRASEAALAQLRAAARSLRRPLILGATRLSYDSSQRRKFNCAVAFSANGEIVAIHDKRYLVPWGEFVPYGILRSLGTARSTTNRDFEAGEDATLFSIECDPGGSLSMATPICYEICFPRMIRKWASEADRQRRAMLIVNIGNENQLSGSWLPRVMLVQARFRAIESRRTVVRSISDGYCAIIDGNGAVRDSLAADAGTDPRAALVGTVPVDARFSPYTFAGEWFGVSCCCAFAALSFVAPRGDRRASRSPQAGRPSASSSVSVPPR